MIIVKKKKKEMVKTETILFQSWRAFFSIKTKKSKYRKKLQGPATHLHYSREKRKIYIYVLSIYLQLTIKYFNCFRQKRLIQVNQKWKIIFLYKSVNFIFFILTFY